MASAVESPRPFSLRVSPALAQPQLALRLLAGWQVDHRPLALSLGRLALRPDPDRQAAWLEVLAGCPRSFPPRASPGPAPPGGVPG